MKKDMTLPLGYYWYKSRKDDNLIGWPCYTETWTPVKVSNMKATKSRFVEFIGYTYGVDIQSLDGEFVPIEQKTD